LRNGSAKTSTANGARPYALLTLHRPSNVDNRETFLSILEGIKDLSDSCPIFFSAHPRTQKRINEFGLETFFHFKNGKPAPIGLQEASQPNGIHVLEPLGYLDFLCLMKHAALVVTDSGGIQEETTCLGVPCITVRENTERPVTVSCGTNTIAGTQSKKIREAIKAHSKKGRSARTPEKWDGKAGARIIEAIMLEANKPA
jgi:UDP-N-acetylglucosamine 2-epimerase (non-hydrolysing)